MHILKAIFQLLMALTCLIGLAALTFLVQSRLDSAMTQDEWQRRAILAAIMGGPMAILGLSVWGVDRLYARYKRKHAFVKTESDS